MMVFSFSHHRSSTTFSYSLISLSIYPVISRHLSCFLSLSSLRFCRSFSLSFSFFRPLQHLPPGYGYY